MGSRNDPLTIRDCRNEDRQAVRDVTLAAYREFASVLPAPFWNSYEQHLRTALAEEGPAERIVADRDGEILGSVLLYPPAVNAYRGGAPSTGWPEVRLLAVAPAARGQGVGTALMEECIRRARCAGASALGLHTMDAMKTAVRMYERMGFVRLPQTDFTPAPGVLVKGYRLDLQPIGTSAAPRP